MNDIINKLLHIIKTDIHVYNNLIEKKYDEREKVDVDVLVYQDDEYVDADAYHIDLKIEYLKGSIGASKHIMQLIKDNTKGDK
tara:strand:+ start:1156 stop:1404 length:249 start_codon:yes stop_codon:yes gene_type:complete